MKLFVREQTAEEKAAQKAWEAGAYDRELEAVKLARHNAYTAPGGSDAVLAKHLRGEATKEEWLDAVKAINDAHPYPKK
jgi:hypothetical protein